MKLTMEACSQIQATCESLTKLNNIVSHEEFNDIMSEVNDINRSITAAMGTIASVETMRDSLLKCGYSDEWFDQIREFHPNFEALVQLDMQKFFSGMDARKEVCLEGFADAIKRWIKNVWEFIKALFKKILAGIEWFLNEIGRNEHKSNSIFMEAFRRCESKMTDYFGIKEWQLENFYDIKQIMDQVSNVGFLASVFYRGSKDSTMINNPFFGQAMHVEDGKDPKIAFANALKSELDARRIPYANIRECGFEFNRYISGDGKILHFIGMDGSTDFNKDTIKIESLDTFRAIFNNIRDWNNMSKSIIDSLTDCKSVLISDYSKLNKEIKDINSATNPGDYRDTQMKMTFVGSALTIISDSLAFTARGTRAIEASRKAAIDILRDINAWKPGYVKTAEKAGVQLKPTQSGIWEG